MKYTHLMSIGASVLLFGCNSGKKELPENSFRLTGSIKGVETGIVKISAIDAESRNATTLDSVAFQNGTFTLSGPLDAPRELNLSIEKDGVNYNAGIMSDKSEMQLQLDTANYDRKMGNYVMLTPELTGSAFNEEYQVYQAQIKPIREKLNKIMDSYNELNKLYSAARREKDEEGAAKYLEQIEGVKEQMEPFQEQISSVTDEYIAGHSDSHVSAYLMVYNMKVASYKLEQSEEIYGAMSPEIQNSDYGKSIKSQIDKLKKASPGAEAALFEATDINGETLKLADYRGQYVLLDFWASWCVPCRKGNPHLLDLYAKYRDKGFEIIGISDDDSNPDAWRKAVEDDGIGVWKHVLRGMKVDRSNGGFKVLDDGISKGYDIHFLPTKILVDPEGVIIGRYGSEEGELDAKLKEVFGE
ncbi:redoxin domain-containing protein [Sinomicrobium sp.]